MAEASTSLQRLCDRPRGDQIQFLPDMRSGGTGGRAGNHRARRVVQRVEAICEKPIAVLKRGGPVFARLDLNGAPHMFDVLPADLIGEAVLIVRGRVKLIESTARAVF